MGIKIILADDHGVVLHGTSAIIKSHIKDVEIKHARNFSETIILLKEFEPTILFLDINMAGGNTTTMIDKIKKVNKKTYILIFSAYEEINYALRYIQAGADGFLSKEAPEEDMIEAINSLLKSGKYISSMVREKIVENAFLKKSVNPLDQLSEREISVAEFLAKGEGNLEIANQLNIHVSTVSTYRSRIFEKLNITNIVGLIDIFRVYKS